MITNPTITSVEVGHSLYSFINTYCLGDKEGSSHNSAFHRLCSLMRKMYVKRAVVEDVSQLYSEIAAECAALTAWHGSKIEIKAYRITFLTEEFDELDKIPSLRSESFLASSIILNYRNPQGSWNSYLFSAIVSLPMIKGRNKFPDMPLLNNYVHIHKNFKREVSVSATQMYEFQINGTFFCQQNSITSVCSHASLCMTLNNMNDPSLPPGLITPEEINGIIGVDHITKKFGIGDQSFKFTHAEFAVVLKKYNLTYELMNFFENPNIEYNDYVYKYIESKCPVLLIFRTKPNVSHVVPILGHTLNTDMWRPEAETRYPQQPNGILECVKSSSAWVDHFIIHDDNFGMYFCLLADALRRITLPKYDPTFRADHAIVIKPSDVLTPPREAEEASIIVIGDILAKWQNLNLPLDVWTERLMRRLLNYWPIVVRSFLVNKGEYLLSLDNSDFEGGKFASQEKDELIKDLPDRFWLSEITLPNLYTANKTKIIDFFYECSNPADVDKIYDRWIQIRFPYVLIKRNYSGQLSSHSLGIKSHYPMIKHKSDDEILEW